MKKCFIIIVGNRCRGFGQLVRAKNIKTVGDLSALTPTEIKTLPVRSPKISNVKKALRIYEQQVSQVTSSRSRISPGKKMILPLLFYRH